VRPAGSAAGTPATQAVDRVYATLRQGILDGVYAPGARLGEADLADALGVSRTPVREALRRLGSEGLLSTLPNKGARVRRWTTSELSDISDLRAILEGYAAGQAATRVTERGATRADDRTGEAAMEDRKKQGYF